MPELTTHTLLGLMLNKIAPKTARKFQLIFFFLTGNILPDLISRAPMIVFPKNIPFFDTFHTLMGGLIMSYIVVLFFDVARRKCIFCCLFAGSAFHLITDLIQKNIFGGGYRLFFPLDIEISIGLIWPEDSLYVLPFLFVIVLFIYRIQIMEIIKKGLSSPR